MVRVTEQLHYINVFKLNSNVQQIEGEPWDWPFHEPFAEHFGIQANCKCTRDCPQSEHWVTHVIVYCELQWGMWWSLGDRLKSYFSWGKLIGHFAAEKYTTLPEDTILKKNRRVDFSTSCLEDFLKTSWRSTKKTKEILKTRCGNIPRQLFLWIASSGFSHSRTPNSITKTSGTTFAQSSTKSSHS